MTPRQYSKRLTIWIDPDTLAKLKHRAKEERRPFTWVVRDILTEAVSAPQAPTESVKSGLSEPQLTDAERAVFHARITEVKNFKPKE